MERMSNLFTNLTAFSTFDTSDAAYEKALNNREPVEPREGIECNKCGNHEYIWVVKDGERMTRECDCKQQRNSLARIRKSGLSEQLDRCTFANFETPEEWQKHVKSKVLQFVSDKDRKWLIVAGQSGCGKSHLCTAAAAKFLKAGADVRYMRWVHESTLLKASITSEYDYNKRMNPLKTCKVLYIDDFFKTQQGQNPSPADVRLAFDLLDYRCTNKGLITIISTERTLDDLMYIDAAVGGRIYEMTRNYCIVIGGNDKNWRMRGK